MFLLSDDDDDNVMVSRLTFTTCSLSLHHILQPNLETHHQLQLIYRLIIRLPFVFGWEEEEKVVVVVVVVVVVIAIIVIIVMITIIIIMIIIVVIKM